MEAQGDQVWVCEASKIEKQHEVNHKRGNFLLAYQISLCSVKPFEEDKVRSTLTHLRRKCPNLRLCFGLREGVLWLRHCSNQEIDFQVMTDVTAEEVLDELQNYRYSSETGPLWCARLLIETAANRYNMDNEDFPYTAQFFLGIHHGISDGVSNLKICGCFVSVLNDVVAGISINDQEQIGQFVSDWETDKIVANKMLEIQNDPQLMQELGMALADKGYGMPTFMKIFPPPEGEDKTHSLTHILDVDTTGKLLSKCRAEGISLNSAYTALGIAATVKIVSEKGYVKDFYRMCHGHIINLRRYWPGDTSQVLGCHAHTPLDLWVQVPRNLKDFWELSKNIHKDIQYHLKAGTVLLREAYTKLSTEGELNFDLIFSSSNPMQVDLCTTNLGDVTSLVTEGGLYVKPFLVIRHVSLHNAEIKNFAHVFQTLRGRLIVNLLYNTKYATKELAELYCKTIFGLLEEVL